MWLSECYILLFFVVVFSVLGLVVTILVILIIYGAPSCWSLEYLQRYKDMLISSLSLSLSHTHTHTHTHKHYKYMHYWCWVGRMRRKKTTDQYSTREKVGFQFWLKRVKTNTDSERKGVPDHRSNVLEGSLPMGPPEQHGIAEYPRLSKESKKENRNEATQVWRSCTRECGSSWVILYWIWLLT